MVGERRTNGERKYYLINLPDDMQLKTLAATIKARWICEQARQQMKELGLDYFEERSWAGLHRHTLMTTIAYAFLQARRLTPAEGRKKNRRATATPTLPAVRQEIPRHLTAVGPIRCPHCRKSFDTLPK
jgi:SRSO17 transposase